jgi:hypothetical protein
MMASRATVNGEGLQSLSLALSLIPSLPRPLLSRLVQRAIDHLDELDGDPDVEGADSEDDPDFTKHPKRLRKNMSRWYGPGCQIADSDYCNGHEDRGGGWITPAERRDVHALKRKLAS